MRVVRLWGVGALVLASAAVLSGCDAASALINATPSPTSSPTGPIIVDLNTPDLTIHTPTPVPTPKPTDDPTIVWSKSSRVTKGCVGSATDVSGTKRSGIVEKFTVTVTNKRTTPVTPWLLVSASGKQAAPQVVKGSGLNLTKRLSDGTLAFSAPAVQAGKSATLSVSVVFGVDPTVRFGSAENQIAGFEFRGTAGTTDEMQAAYDSRATFLIGWGTYGMFPSSC